MDHFLCGCTLKTSLSLDYNALPHMDLLLNLTCWIVFILHYIKSLGWPQMASLESKLGFEQLFFFWNFSYFMWLGFTVLPDNLIIQNTKARQKILSPMHVKSITSSYLHIGLTPLIYLPLVSFPSSPSHSLCYQKNTLHEKLMKYGPF